MLNAIGQGVTSVIGWIGQVIQAIVQTASEGTAAGAFNALLPVIGIGIGASVIFLGVKLIRSLCWGM